MWPLVVVLSRNFRRWEKYIFQAYESFKAALQDVRSSYRHLNPQLGQLPYQEHQCTQKVLELHVIQQLMQGAVISSI